MLIECHSLVPRAGRNCFFAETVTRTNPLNYPSSVPGTSMPILGDGNQGSRYIILFLPGEVAERLVWM